MSRIGKAAIEIPQGVTCHFSNHQMRVEGPRGVLTQVVAPDLSVVIGEGQILVSRPTDEKRHKAMHGLFRSLINNMVVGVSTGFEKSLKVMGVGYKANLVEEGILSLELGYAHLIYVVLPREVKAEVSKSMGDVIIKLTSHDKQLLGYVAMTIRSLRKPNRYKLRGIQLTDEVIRLKPSKTAGK